MVAESSTSKMRRTAVLLGSSTGHPVWSGDAPASGEVQEVCQGPGHANKGPRRGGRTEGHKLSRLKDRFITVEADVARFVVFELAEDGGLGDAELPGGAGLVAAAALEGLE